MTRQRDDNNDSDQRRSVSSNGGDASSERVGAAGAGPVMRRSLPRTTHKLQARSARKGASYGDSSSGAHDVADVSPGEIQFAGRAHEDPFAMHLIDDAGVHNAAARGLAEPAAPLPHLDRIQASFGHHDVSGVQAHIGGAAAEATAAMGASAYATGDHVAFAGSPDLHTAAHEAAHTVQQRGGVQLRGGVGVEGDRYEQHADAVADRVVRGASAEELLDGAPSAGDRDSASVQHKKPARGDDKDGGEEPELEKQPDAQWPVFAKTGKPYIIEDRGGKPGFWAARDWITAADDLEKHTDRRTKRTAYVSPSRAREVLGAMGWVAPDKIEFAAKQLTFQFHGALSHFVVGAEAAFATGLPHGRQALVDRDRDGGLMVTLALDDESIAPGSPHQATASEMTRAFRAAADFTGLDIDTQGHAFLTGGWVPPAGTAGNGVLSLTLDRTVCRTLFGMDAYDAWVGEKKKKSSPEPKTPKLKLENYYKSPIPGQLTHHGDIVESGEALRLEVLVDWPHHHPDNEIFDAPPMVTPSKFGNVALLNCSWRFERIDSPVSDPNPASTIQTQSTMTAEATHRFRLAPGEASGTFRVICDARFDEYFEPATFTRDVVVMSSAAAMNKLKSEAFAGLGATSTDRQKGSWTGDVRPGFKPSPLAGGGDDVDDPMARDRAGQRERLQNVADYLRGNPASDEAVEALDRELARQKNTEKLLAADRDKGWQAFQIRGTYLSRTEGLASGPLDLHGSVHTERHYDTYPGDGPSTTMRVRNDKTVVRIRDLSRRFEQSDFVFEGKADTFDEALKQAFDDLAVAYPKGLVAIEAEQIKDGALASPDGGAGPDSASGPGNGKVIGFQRSTETTWKKVKEAVWDPVASIAVNLGAIALMTLVPGSAAIVAPALVAYNSIPSIDRISTESDRGTLTVGTFAMSTGEIALNLLPLVARAKPFTAGWYAVETANWGGQVALMGAGAVDMAQKLQAKQVAALAQEYEQFLELKKTSLPSDPGLAIAEDRIRRAAEKLDGEISRQFWEQIGSNFFQMVAGSVIHNTSTHARAAVIEHLGTHTGATIAGGSATPPPGAGGAPPVPPAVPPHGGSSPPDGVGRTSPGRPTPRPDVDTPSRTTGAKPSGDAAPPSHLAAEAGAERRIRPGSDGDFRADAGDLHSVHHDWAKRRAGDTVTEIHYDPDADSAHFDILRGSERIRVTATIAPRITSAAQLTSTSNRVVGHPISASEGHSILRALNENRLDALAAVGVDVPAGTKLAPGIEFGLGDIGGGKTVVVLGERAAVDWTHLPGIKPKAHTHPSVPGNDLLKNTGSESVPLARILEPTKDPLIARELVLPSPPDVAVMARLGVDGHRVITPFVVQNGHVMKPKPGDNSPRLEWVIEQPREVGRTADGSTVYEAILVAEVDGKPIKQTRVWSTEPPNPTPDNLGNHYMTAPEMTPVAKPASDGTKKTPAGGPTSTDPITRLTTGKDALTAAEVTALSAKHGKDAVEWAGESLDGGPARKLLDTLDPPVVAGMRDVTADEALRNLDVFGKPSIDKAVPPLTGSQLKVEREQLGERAAVGIANDKLNGKVSKPSELATHADNLAAATAKPHEALQSDSLIVDNNVLTGIKELMGGMAWKDLQDHKKKGINWLRAKADPQLPELKGDPPARGMTDIIGEGHDLRAANVVLGEHTPMAGLDKSGFEITIGRDSTQYKAVLDELATTPEPIGQNKGDADRAIVVDAMFAASPGQPKLMTGDYAIIERLYKRYGPGKIKLPKQKHKQKLAEAIGDVHPQGYDAVIPDGLGGTRTITIVPMVK